MHGEDGLSPGEVGRRDENLAVESTRAQESLVEILEPVRGADDDDAARILEAVQLDEELVQRLVVLAVEAWPERRIPTASSSSMNTIAGWFLRAVSKSLRMREAPRPANISTNADALCE